MIRPWPRNWKSDAWTLQWHHNERDGVSNHQPHDCLLICSGTDHSGEFPAQRTSNAENVSIWWRHHGKCHGLIGWYYPDSKVHGATMGPIWGRQDPGGPHGGPMNFAIWVVSLHFGSSPKEFSWHFIFAYAKKLTWLCGTVCVRKLICPARQVLWNPTQPTSALNPGPLSLKKE